MQRKAGLRFFSNANLKHFIDETLPPILQDTKHTLDEAALSGSQVDLQSVLLEMTTRLMGKIAYDVRFQPLYILFSMTMSDEMKMDMHGGLPFSKAFDFASGAVTARFTNPFWKPKEYLFGSKLRKAVKDVKDFGEQIVANSVHKRRQNASQAQQSSPPKGDAMQENLINALLDNISDHKVVADAAMNFLSAGRDTTAQSLTWTFYSLMRHPECLVPLISELSKLQSQTSSTSLPLSYTTTQSPSLPYTTAIL